MSEQTPDVLSEQTPDQKNIDIDQLSDDQVGDLVDATARGEEYSVPESSDESDAKESDEPDGEEDEQQEEVAKAEGEEADEPVAAESAESEEEAAPADEWEGVPDAIRLRFEQQAAQSKHFETLLSQKAGSDGFYEQENARLREQLKQAQGKTQDDVANFDYNEPATSPAPQQPSYDPAINGYVVRQAVELAGQRWRGSHSDIEVVAPFMKSHLEKNGDEAHAIMGLRDPSEADRRTTQLMESAYYAGLSDMKAKQLVDLPKREFDQAAALKKRKRAAAVSTPSQQQAAPKRKQTDLADLTDDEVGALVDRLAEESVL